VIRLEHVEKAQINKLDVKGTADALVQVEGNDSKDIQVVKNNTPGINKQLAMDNKQ
jgi:hypothetical protein